MHVVLSVLSLLLPVDKEKAVDNGTFHLTQATTVAVAEDECYIQSNVVALDCSRAAFPPLLVGAECQGTRTRVLRATYASAQAQHPPEGKTAAPIAAFYNQI